MNMSKNETINTEQCRAAKQRWDNAQAAVDELRAYDGVITDEYIRRLNAARSELFTARLVYVTNYGTIGDMKAFESEYGNNISLCKRRQELSENNAKQYRV